jgi:hypothetical protein
VPDTKVCDLLRRRIVVDEEITRYNWRRRMWEAFG